MPQRVLLGSSFLSFSWLLTGERRPGTDSQPLFLASALPVVWKQVHCRNVLPDGSVAEESTYRAGDLGSIPGTGRSLEKEGNGDPLQYTCLENPMDRGAWWSTVRGVTQSWTWLTNWAHRCRKNNRLVWPVLRAAWWGGADLGVPYMEGPGELPVLLSSPLSTWILRNYDLASGSCGHGHLAAESLLVN